MNCRLTGFWRATVSIRARLVVEAPGSRRRGKGSTDAHAWGGGRPPTWVGMSRPIPASSIPQVRRAALAWVCATLPVVVFAGHLATTASQYVVVFALLASGLYTSPAIVNTWIAARRAPRIPTAGAGGCGWPRSG